MWLDGAASPETGNHWDLIAAVAAVVSAWFIVHGLLWYRGWIKRKRKGGFRRMKSQGQRMRERQNKSGGSRRH